MSFSLVALEVGAVPAAYGLRPHPPHLRASGTNGTGQRRVCAAATRAYRVPQDGECVCVCVCVSEGGGGGGGAELSGDTNRVGKRHSS